MPTLKLSNLSKVTAEDDLAVVAVDKKKTNTSASTTVPKKKKNCNFNLIPDELIVHIATYCQGGELARFSESNSRYLKLLFNQEISNFPNHTVIKSKIQTHFGEHAKQKELKTQEKKYQKDEESIDFDLVQIQVWKPLVCFYFPRFEKALNIKNWMHVLRRRVAHIKINGANFLPILRRKEGDPIYDFKSDDGFIENCEYIYKCPLKFNSLDGYGDERSCRVCGKKVYNVENISTFKDYISKGYCISLGMSEEEEMGEMAEFY